MREQVKPALLALLVLTLLTGVVYPLLVTVVGQLVFPHQANGSLITANGTTLGSELIGQPFSAKQYFWGRLSATGPHPYNAAVSSGSNYGPLSPALAEAVAGRYDALHQADPGAAEKVPVDLLTASGSGLDPEISPAAAEYQVARVATARGMSEDQVRELVAKHTLGRTLGLLGEPRVNVLLLNLELDAQEQR